MNARTRRTPNLARSQNAPLHADLRTSPEFNAKATIFTTLLRFMRGSEISAANEAVLEIPAVAASNAFQEGQKDALFVPFGEKDAFILHPRSGRLTKCRQVFDAAAANKIFEDLNSVKGKLALSLRLIKIYEGHPDDPVFADQHKNQRAVGWVTGASVSNEGMTFTVRYNRYGQELIDEGAYSFYSQRWGLEIADPTAANLVGRPARILSFGLTNTPNWPNPAIAAANGISIYPEVNMPDQGATEGAPPVNTLMQRLLALIGDELVKTGDDIVARFQQLLDVAKKVKEAVELRWKAEDAARTATANEATPLDKLLALFKADGDALAAANAKVIELTPAAAKAPALEADVARLHAEIVAANAELLKLGPLTQALDDAKANLLRLNIEVTAANEQLAAEKATRVRIETDLADKAAALTAADKKLTTEVTAANAKFDAERKARAKEHVDAAIAQGKIIAGDRAGWEEKFVQDFDGTFAAVSNAKPLMKLDARATGLAARKTTAEASQKFTDLVKQRMQDKNESWDAAWAACSNAHPDLISQMQQPDRPFSQGKR